MFNFDDDAPALTTSNGKGKATEPIAELAADDDFDDFQSATGTTTTAAAAATPATIPSLFSSSTVPSSSVRPAIPTTSSQSSFSNFGISSPPLQQSTRPPNPPTSFGRGMSSAPSGIGIISPISSTTTMQPNYFSQPAPTTVHSYIIVSNL